MYARTDDKQRRDRLMQTGMEHFKAQSDYYKHLSTITVTAMAIFAALLGGVFYSSPDGLASSSRGVLILAIYGLFTVSLMLSLAAAANARGKLKHMSDVQTNKQFEDLRGPKLARFSTYAQGTFVLGIVVLVAFIVINTA